MSSSRRPPAPGRPSPSSSRSWNGCAPDVERIIELTYQPQMALASATMPDWVSRMIQRHLDDPVRIVVAAPAEETLEHGLLRVARPEKLRTLSKLLQRHRGSAIVFGRTKHGVRKLSRDLRNLGHQGAPALPELDVRHLLAEGDWRYIAAALVEPEPRVRSTQRATSGTARPGQSWNRRRRRPRGRGPYRSDQRPASAGA